MNKFWPVVTIAFLIGIAAAFLTFNGSNAATAIDLETECRYDRGEDVYFGLSGQNKLLISGNYPVENTDVDMNYEYSRTDDQITLNIKNSELPRPDSFVDACLGSAVYEIKTPGLEPGFYTVTVQHNGEPVETRVLKLN